MKKTKQKLLLLIGVMIKGNSPPVFAGIWDAHDSNAPVTIAGLPTGATATTFLH